VFPLLDPEGRVTPLGSYLSYLGMKRASYLPEAVFRIPNIGKVFDTLGLFALEPLPEQAFWRRELPFRFMAQDFADGTLRRSGGMNEITLRFHGTRPGQTFTRSFPDGDLHRVPGWIATRIQAWAGFQPSKAQAAVMAKPGYTCPEDLLLGARAEHLFRIDPGLVNGWEAVFRKHPEDALMYDRWLSMAQRRGYDCPLQDILARFRNNPQDALLRLNTFHALCSENHLGEALGIALENIKADDDNADNYEAADWVLQKLDCTEVDLRLLKAWCDKHPSNQEAWMKLAEVWKAYAWEARGSGFAGTVTPEGWRLMKERMGRAMEAAERALALAPGDCRVWASMMAMGTGVPLSRQRMEACFQKVLELDPYHYPAYALYLNFLAPKWFGRPGEDRAFVDRAAEWFPGLTLDLVTGAFWPGPIPEGAAAKRAYRESLRRNILRSPDLGLLEARLRERLRSHPVDMKTWNEYVFWMGKIGRRDEALAHARERLAGADPVRASVLPAVVLNALRYQEEDCVGTEESEAFEAQSDTMRLREAAFRDLLAADPSHWAALNGLARLLVREGRLAEARALFGRIGTHWTPGVWTLPDFRKAQAQASR
jgi:tetratricopeptide (TPR) repeat protein